MSDRVTLYQLKMSANNIKIRLALNYKGIPFERVDVNPQDREQIVKISGQPLTPVLTHGETVIFDSASILRYIDANLPGPRLYSADYQEMKEIEGWEAWAKNQLQPPFYMVLNQWRAPEEQRNPAECSQASSLLHERTAKLEERLAKGAWLVGDKMTAADLTVAPHVFPGMVPAELADADARFKFFADSYHLGEGRELTRAWAAKVMAYDS